MSESIVVLRSTGTVTDRYNNVLPDWAAPTRRLWRGCKVAPGVNVEDEAGRVRFVSEGFTVYAPPNTDVRAGDRVECRGDTYDVEGEPGEWRGGFTGRDFGVVITLRRTEG